VNKLKSLWSFSKK